MSTSAVNYSKPPNERFYEKVKKVKADVAALHICFSFRRVLEGWRAVKGGADRQRSS